MLKKRSDIYSLLVALILLSMGGLPISCYTETALPIDLDFELSYVNDDESVPVFMDITNETEGADTYEWTFVGGEPTGSTDRNPGVVAYAKAGTYNVGLKASNTDGVVETLEKEITVLEGITVDFDMAIVDNDFPPMTVNLVNNSPGENLTYSWVFEGGEPATSAERHPGQVVFETPGDHHVSLSVSNEFETLTQESTVRVAPDISVDFDYTIDEGDEDMQAPVAIQLSMDAISATSYLWTFEGGSPASSTQAEPSVVFNDPGVHAIHLEVTNGKRTANLSKELEVLEDTNLRIFDNLAFGVVQAHNSDQVGAIFSAELGRVLSQQEVTEENGATLDLVFFGLNGNFGVNKFVSPDEAGTNGFATIPGAGSTRIINSLEHCACGIAFSSIDFDTMVNDTPLQNFVITETSGGIAAFDATVNPRIILFQTADGRKGAVKITDFVDQGTASYIRADLKIQKLPN
ncbi:MAG: PKD domain-containing protein [Flavobacteriaceae bacterium]